MIHQFASSLARSHKKTIGHLPSHSPTPWLGSGCLLPPLPLASPPVAGMSSRVAVWVGGEGRPCHLHRIFCRPCQPGNYGVTDEVFSRWEFSRYSSSGYWGCVRVGWTFAAAVHSNYQWGGEVSPRTEFFSRSIEDGRSAATTSSQIATRTQNPASTRSLLTAFVAVTYYRDFYLTIPVHPVSVLISLS